MKFITHSFWIRPVFWVKAPVSLSWPVEEVDYHYIKVNTHFLVFTCNCKNFILSSVTEFTLPESKIVFCKSWSTSYSSSKVFNNLCRFIANSNPVIHFFCRFSSPFCNILCKTYLTNSRIIPEEAISQ